jgi:hypothetical protein
MLDVRKNEREALRQYFADKTPKYNNYVMGDLFDVWFDDCATFRESFPLSDFVQKYHQDEEVQNFAYLRGNNTVYNTLYSCGHGDFLSGLYTLEQLASGKTYVNKPEDGEDGERNARLNKKIQWWFGDPWEVLDLFLEDGMGIYQSSVGRSVYRHKSFQMNPDERAAFGDLKFHVYDWEPGAK